MIEMTMATMGRLMKKLEIMGKRLLLALRG